MLPSLTFPVPIARVQRRVATASAGLLALFILCYIPTIAAAQQELFPESRAKPEFHRLNHNFYVNAQYFVQQTGYEQLWQRYAGHLPTGKSVVIVQCENSLADPANFAGVEIQHAPGVENPKWERHAGTVAQILYGPQPHKSQHSVFEHGFSPGVKNVLAYTSNDFRRHVLKVEKHNTRGTELPAWPATKIPVKVLNISNTFGNGGESQNIRALDYLIDTTDVLACTAQPGSLKSNASLSGNLWNSLVVGKTSPDFGYAEGTDYENIDGRRRRKPDIVACSSLSKDGGASSWSTPTVSSAAAMLIERARATENTRRAERNFVLRAILLAGTTTTGLFSPVYDDAGKLKDVDKDKPWVWTRTSETPLDKLFGAGNLNIDNSYRILEAGETAKEAGPCGWLLGEQVVKSRPRDVTLVLKHPAKGFTAALAWNRHITLPKDAPYDFTVANLRLELRDAHGKVLQWSDDPGNNVEYLRLETELEPGTYTLRVISHDEAAENFGLAWHSLP